MDDDDLGTFVSAHTTYMHLANNSLTTPFRCSTNSTVILADDRLGDHVSATHGIVRPCGCVGHPNGTLMLHITIHLWITSVAHRVVGASERQDECDGRGYRVEMMCIASESQTSRL
jgi:hypothetical protein